MRCAAKWWIETAATAPPSSSSSLVSFLGFEFLELSRQEKDIRVLIERGLRESGSEGGNFQSSTHFFLVSTLKEVGYYYKFIFFIFRQSCPLQRLLFFLSISPRLRLRRKRVRRQRRRRETRKWRGLRKISAHGCEKVDGSYEWEDSAKAFEN